MHDEDRENGDSAPREGEAPPEKKEAAAGESARESAGKESRRESSVSGRHSGRHHYAFDPAARLKELVEAGMEIWTVAARYGKMSNSGLFFCTACGFAPEEHIVVKTKMGVEMGRALTAPVPYDKLEERDAPVEFHGEVLRPAQKEDISRWQYIQDELCEKEFDICQDLIKKHGLAMKLVDVEHLFGGDRIIFYFLADGRVDFRALVRDLSREFRTRIEMRQIGVRDEAKLLADYEHCGRPLCCKTFLKDLQPVTMKMAKHQKTTLDPTKISGRCGRLMCCLRFEDEVYTWLRSKLPRKGWKVQAGRIRGEVADVNLLKEQVLVRTESGELVWVHSSEIRKAFDPRKQD